MWVRASEPMGNATGFAADGGRDGGSWESLGPALNPARRPLVATGSKMRAADADERDMPHQPDRHQAQRYGQFLGLSPAA